MSREITRAEDPTNDDRSDRTDFWTGLVLAAIGLAAAIGSWRMPRLEERGINPLTVPGIVPGILGAALFVLGLILALRRYEPKRGRMGLSVIIGTGSERVNLAIAFGLNVIFGLVLVGNVHFWLATFLYMAAFMAVFGLTKLSPVARRKRVALILAVSSLATAAIVYLFGELFFVRLP